MQSLSRPPSRLNTKVVNITIDPLEENCCTGLQQHEALYKASCETLASQQDQPFAMTCSVHKNTPECTKLE